MSNNYLLIIEYDGTRYGGWQKQPGIVTIQGEIESAAIKVLGSPVKLTAAGRTDKGVHALCQAANLTASRQLDPSSLCSALNSFISNDIAIKSVKPVPVDFNARFSAKKKVYQYRIWNNFRRSAWKMHSWHVEYPLNVTLMRRASKELLGKHDFSAFEARGSTQQSKIVRLDKITIKKAGGEILLNFEADRFLYKMVRNITGTLVEAGLGRIDCASIKGILEGKKRKFAGRTAPSHGLFLKKVIF